MLWARLKWLPVAAAAYICYFFGLTAVGIIGPDEPRYASIGREMAASGDWVTPVLWGAPWFEKPALLYWMIGAAYRAGLGDDLAPRLPVAILSVVFLVVYYRVLSSEFGKEAAAYAAVILGTCAGWLAFSQVGVTDLPLSACFALSMLLTLRWVDTGERKRLWIAGVMLGFAALAKGLVPIVLAAPLIWAGRKRWRDLVIYAVAAALVAVPWYVMCAAVNGYAFIDELFVRHHFSRFASDALQHTQPFWFYVPVLAGLMFPWTPMLLLMFGRRGFGDPRRMLLLLWFVFGFVFFSVSANKLPGYILPLLPPLTALIGLRLAESSRRVPVLLGLSALVLMLIPIAGEVLPQALVSGLSRVDIAWTSPFIVPALIAAAIAGHFEWTGKRLAAVATVAFTLVCGIAFLKWTMYPRLDRVATVRPFWRGLLYQDVCLDNAHRTITYGLNFYAHQALPSCSEENARVQISTPAPGKIQTRTAEF